MTTETSPPIGIHAAMPRVAARIAEVGKERNNAAQGFKFRGIDDIINVIHMVLAEEGVTPYPRVLVDSIRMTRSEVERSGGRKGLDTHVVAAFETIFAHKDGSSTSCITLGEGADSADKACNKAMSAAFKYALIQTFTIPTEDIFEDGDSSGGAEAPPAASSPSGQRSGAPKAEKPPKAEKVEKAAPVPADPEPIRPPAPAPTGEADAAEEDIAASLIGRIKALHKLQQDVVKGLCAKQAETEGFESLARIAAGKLPAAVMVEHAELLTKWIDTVPTVGVLEATKAEQEGPFD